MRGICSHMRRDDGMTLLEVVIASVILFIILTGVLGLLGQTIMIGSQARQINVATNAVNAYVEWVRAQPFDTIDSSGGSIETTTVVRGEYTVLIEPTVEEGDNDALKNLVLEVTVTRTDGTSYAYSTTVVIRDRDQHMTAAQRSPTTDPKISFVTPTPPDGTVVWHDEGTGGSYWKDSGGTTRPVQISLKAEASEGRTVEVVDIWCDDMFRLQDPFGNLAFWEVPEWTTMPSPFSWDIAQLDNDTPPQRQVADGMRSIVAYVHDSNEVAVSAVRTLLVDNYPPVVPVPSDGSPVMSHNPAGSMSGRLVWVPFPDGSTNAYSYELELERTQADGTWAEAPGYVGSALSYAVPETPISRYQARLRAVSPRGLASDVVSAGPFFTRPTMAATTYNFTYVNKNKHRIAPSLRVSAPEFPVTGTVSYRWMRVDTGQTLATTTTNQYTAPTVEDVEPTYQVRVTFTPAGGSATEILSEVITLKALTASATDVTVGPGVW